MIEKKIVDKITLMIDTQHSKVNLLVKEKVKREINLDNHISVIPPTYHNELLGLDYESSGHTGFASEKQLNLLKENTIPTRLNTLNNTNLNNDRENQHIYVDDNGNNSSITVKELADLKIRTVDDSTIPTEAKVGDYMFKLIAN